METKSSLCFRWRRDGFSKIAFVRFRFEDELLRAINLGNGRRLDGRSLLVRKAIVRKIDRKQASYHARSRSYVTDLRDNRRVQVRGRSQARGENRGGFDRTRRRFPPRRSVPPPVVDKANASGKNQSLPFNSFDNEVLLEDFDDQVMPDMELNDDLEIQVFIHVEHRNWLERCFVVSMISEDGVSKGISSLSNCNMKLEIFELSNGTLLVCVEDEELIDDGIKLGTLVSKMCQGLVYEIFPWESTGFKRRSIIWLQLEDIPLELWHPNFFTVLSEVWGKLLQIDELTRSRKSLKTARLQILTSNLLEIPKMLRRKSDGDPHLANDKMALGSSRELNADVFKVNTSSGKVLIEGGVNALETNEVIHSLISNKSVLPSGDIAIEKGHKERLEVVSGGNALSIDVIPESNEIIGNADDNDEWRLKILDKEIVRESLNSVRKDKDDLEIFNLIGRDNDESYNHVGNSLAIMVRSDPGTQLSPSESDPINSGSYSNSRSDVGSHLINSGARKALVGKRYNWAKCRVCETKRRKKTRSGVTKLVLGENAITDFDSDISLSDDDIRKRNVILIKEAEDTFEVSKTLGLEFCEDRDKIISRLVGLEGKAALVIGCSLLTPCTEEGAVQQGLGGENNQQDVGDNMADNADEEFNNVEPRAAAYVPPHKPYPEEYDRLYPLPRGYKVHDFTCFSGTSSEQSTLEHISRFTIQCGEANSGYHKLRLFPNSVTGAAFTWYINLPPNSVRTWEEMERLFHTQFYRTEPEVSMADLCRLYQKKGESAEDYLDRFKKLRNRCRTPLQEMEFVRLAQNGLDIELRKKFEGVDFRDFFEMSTKDMGVDKNPFPTPVHMVTFNLPKDGKVAKKGESTPKRTPLATSTPLSANLQSEDSADMRLRAPRRKLELFSSEDEGEPTKHPHTFSKKEVRRKLDFSSKTPLQKEKKSKSKHVPSSGAKLGGDVNSARERKLEKEDMDDAMQLDESGSPPINETETSLMNLADMRVELCKAKIFLEEAKLKKRALQLDRREGELQGLRQTLIDIVYGSEEYTCHELAQKGAIDEDAVLAYRRLAMRALTMDYDDEFELSDINKDSYYRKFPYQALQKKLEDWPSHEATQDILHIEEGMSLWQIPILLEKAKLDKQKKEFEAERRKHIEVKNLLFERQVAIDDASKQLLRKMFIKELQLERSQKIQNGLYTSNREVDGAISEEDAEPTSSDRNLICDEDVEGTLDASSEEETLAAEDFDNKSVDSLTFGQFMVDLNHTILTLPYTFAAKLKEQVESFEPPSYQEVEDVTEVSQEEDSGGNNLDDSKAMVFIKPDESATCRIKPLYIKAHVDGIPLNRVFVDNGATVNLIPFSSLRKLGKSTNDLIKSDVTVSDFSGAIKKTRGILPTQFTIGSKTSLSAFFVVDSSSTYNMLLGRDWIHSNWCVPSSLHQLLMFWNGTEIEVVKADSRPFKVESHAIDVRFYDGSTGPIRFMGEDKHGQPYPIISTGEIEHEALKKAMETLVLSDALISFKPLPNMKLQSLEDSTAPSTNAVYQDLDEITMEELDRAPMKLDDLKAEVYDPLLEVNLGTEEEPRPTYISQLLAEEDKPRFVALLKEYKDCFVWDYEEMPSLSRDLVEHRLPIIKGYHPYQQPPRRMANDVVLKVKEEVERLLKAGFIRTASNFLGFLVHQRGIEIDQNKARAILQAKLPTSKKELQRFLGQVNFLRRFISNTAGKTKAFSPLLKLKHKEEFQWNDEHQEAFEAIKKYLASPPVLVPPKKNQTLYLYISATESSIRSLLAHGRGKGKEQAVYYLSRTLTDVETRYSPIKKLYLSLYFAAIKLRHYMLYFDVCIIAKTDVVKYMLNQPFLRGCLGKWCLALSEFSFKYIPQKAVKGQAIADFLADHPCLDLGEEFEDSNFVMEVSLIPWELEFDGSSTANSAVQLLEKFDDVRIEHVPRHGNETANLAAQLASGTSFLDDIWRKVINIQRRSMPSIFTRDNVLEVYNIIHRLDDWCQPFLDYLRQPSIRVSRRIRTLAVHYTILADELYRRDLDGSLMRCLGNEEAKKVIKDVHEGLWGAHQASRKMRWLIRRHGFCWPTIMKDCMEFAKGCQAFKNEDGDSHKKFINGRYLKKFYPTAWEAKSDPSPELEMEEEPDEVAMTQCTATCLTEV
ncbi:Retrotransposon gag protein [Corchorus capsularis]|uniref:Retrotransposon gag protein n=1 Tax=Corchorus capsularis TaxID=210143 RepID=A0A1R3J3T4_COCAP|nr:Retrotransposon gag protein [Corchorus capsularis]